MQEAANRRAFSKTIKTPERHVAIESYCRSIIFGPH